MQAWRKSLELDHGAAQGGALDLSWPLGSGPKLSRGAVGAKGHFPHSLCALSSAATPWHSGGGAGLGWAELSLLPWLRLFLSQEERVWLCPAGFQQPWAVLSPAGIG